MLLRCPCWIAEGLLYIQSGVVILFTTLNRYKLWVIMSISVTSLYNMGMCWGVASGEKSYICGSYVITNKPNNHIQT